MLDRAARRRECDADEARWEAQLRRILKHETRHPDPVADRRLATVPRSLEVVVGVTRHDSLLIPRTLPAFIGGEREDLLCGKCSDVIGSQTTPPTARRQHPEGDRLIIRCTCGALNLISRTSRVRDGDSRQTNSRRQRPPNLEVKRRTTQSA